jgi:hypothetical protein
MGWNQLKEIKKANEEAARETKELTDCPNDGWPLTDTPQGKHCQFCGEVFK